MIFHRYSIRSPWIFSLPGQAQCLFLLAGLLAGCQTDETNALRRPKPSPTPKETKAPVIASMPPPALRQPLLPAGNYQFVMRTQEASGTREGPNNTIVPAYQIELSVPEFLGPQYAKLNSLIIDFAREIRADFIEENARQSLAAASQAPWFLRISSNVELSTPQWASIRFDKFVHTGTGPTNQDIITLNFQTNPPNEQGIMDCLQSKNKLNELSALTSKLLKTRLGEQTDADWLLKGAGPFEENYQNFTLSKTGIALYFYPGQVCPESLGCQTVILPIPILVNLVKPEILTVLRTPSKTEG